MTLSDFRRITDELLSAYIDDEVTEQERALVEAAIAQDEEIAWRLYSLRQTVTLLRDLPELALPRSFTLTLDQVAQATDQRVGVGAMSEEAMATPAAPPRLQRQVAPTPPTGFWEQVAEGWRRFWQGGNPMLRNAAAVSFALMLFLAGGGQLLNRALTQPVGMMATAPEAPAAAPAASEAMPQTQAVAIAPTATETTVTEATATESTSLQVQEDSSLKTPVEEVPTEETPTGESARIMQAPAESASDGSPATTEEAPEAASAESADSAESTEGSAESDAAVQAGDAAVAEAAAAPASDAPAPTATIEESAVAAAMVAPEQPQGDEMPPLVANPLPGGGAGGRPQSGGGGGGMGGGPEGPTGGETGDLVPEEAHAFDVNPAGAPTPLPAEEGVTASVAAAPAAASAASAADVAVTPAVDEVVPEGEAAEDEVATASEVVPSEAVATEMPVTATPAPTEQAVAEAAIAATIEPTPEAVALVAPGPITSSEVVANVATEGTTPATGPAGSVPVVWVAQGSAFLLTIVLASLWWRSRTPRRPRRS